MGGIGIWQLVIVLMIVFLLFGSKRLKGLGSDVGEAIQGFRKSMGGTAEDTGAQAQQQPLNGPADRQA
ncbi:twin-arginine translocase TatA/TatE family subunit [Pantoea sp. Cy-639]|jgi:sec-independent protein translocase protein TatA|uniref:twin-arginine translocase TatA/TatE family subunit n=1 Tax=Pantoea sp. Cy-639 TaxID=2608360 RepID=UPI001421B5C8|nr:twin-arginine translocase TatA/TatE family subunit [Pantoea sp. Cy-639]NIF16253.1 twin-arginine translocase TatA/TatE family subunit [Pantoea sp. Cy-639]